MSTNWRVTSPRQGRWAGQREPWHRWATHNRCYSRIYGNESEIVGMLERCAPSNQLASAWFAVNMYSYTTSRICGPWSRTRLESTWRKRKGDATWYNAVSYLKVSTLPGFCHLLPHSVQFSWSGFFSNLIEQFYSVKKVQQVYHRSHCECSGLEETRTQVDSKVRQVMLQSLRICSVKFLAV